MVLATGALGLIGLFPGLEWLDGVAVVTGTIAYELPTFCAVDPPAMPTFTVGEYFAAAARLPGPDYTSFVNKFSDLLQNLAWSSWCKCNAGAQPTFTPPSNPGGTSLILNGSPSTPCTHLDTGSYQCTSTLTPVLGPFQLWPGGTFQGTVTPHDAVGSGTHGKWRIYVNTVPNFATASNTAPSLTSTSGVGSTGTNGVTTNAYYWIAAINDVGGTGSTDSYTLDQWCPGNAPASPCGSCPDAHDIAVEVAEILAQVNLIQRQSAPFGYVYGTNHTGLSGHGSFAVSDLIGVSVDVTTLPTNYGQRDGSPVELFDLGFVSLGTADGYAQSRRIDHDGTLVLPSQAGVFTAVGYTLSPGVVVAIRELTREP